MDPKSSQAVFAASVSHSHDSAPSDSRSFIRSSFTLAPCAILHGLTPFAFSYKRLLAHPLTGRTHVLAPRAVLFSPDLLPSCHDRFLEAVKTLYCSNGLSP